MRRLEDYFSSYAEYHQTQGNKITHYFGIPPIVFSTLGFFSQVRPSEHWDLGLALWLLSSLFYCRLDFKKGALFSALSFAIYWMARDVALSVHIGLFFGGWILQGLGHYVYEKRSPAFLTNLSHLWIGPFWIFCRLLGSARERT